MRALVTGITGQDGAYLTQFLEKKKYWVYGLAPSRAIRSRENLDRLNVHPTLLTGDLTDQASIYAALEESNPDEVYNLGAMTFVGDSWNSPACVAKVNGLGVLNVLEAVRRFNPNIRVYQASTSEMFGSTPPPQHELTPFHPRSPYGVAKLYGHWIAVNYRESYNMEVSCGILFNHESPLRGANFVTQKIATAARNKETVTLGNIEARRDWGFAGDYVKAMWLMLQNRPDDYVIATGVSHSVMDFLKVAYDKVGLDWEKQVKQSDKLYRPAEVWDLRGDNHKAQIDLGWQPETSFRELVEMMVDGQNRDANTKPRRDAASQVR